MSFQLCVEGRKTYYLSKVRTNWLNAISNCHKSGLKIVTIKTGTEQADFLNLISKADQNIFQINPHSKKKSFYIGTYAYDPNARSNWTLIETGEQVSYGISYAEGQPDNGGAPETCLAFEADDKGKWGIHDFNCGREEYYFCEK